MTPTRRTVIVNLSTAAATLPLYYRPAHLHHPFSRTAHRTLLTVSTVTAGVTGTLHRLSGALPPLPFTHTHRRCVQRLTQLFLSLIWSHHAVHSESFRPLSTCSHLVVATRLPTRPLPTLLRPRLPRSTLLSLTIRPPSPHLTHSHRLPVTMWSERSVRGRQCAVDVVER